MPTTIICSGCQKHLRVPDHAAGKRVKCPSCQIVLQVAADNGAGVPTASLAPDRWTLQTEDGQSFGPVTKLQLDQWFAEGRITAGCHLLQQGAGQWQTASQVYPQLARPAAAQVPDQFPCPHCQNIMANEPSMAGQMASCPFCNQPFRMPGSPVEPATNAADDELQQQLASIAAQEHTRRIQKVREDAEKEARGEDLESQLLRGLFG